ncbi:hypothetical protein ACQ4PT_036870 [Festuca glaucescens]
MAFAASASGDIIVAASSAGYGGRTLIYDDASVSPGPGMRSPKQRLFLVPVGDHMFFGIYACPSSDFPKGLPRFEALQQLRRGRWAWTADKDPPGLARGQREDVRAYFVAGPCVYSLRRQANILPGDLAVTTVASLLPGPEKSTTSLIDSLNNAGGEHTSPHGVREHGSEDRVDKNQASPYRKAPTAPPREAHVAFVHDRNEVSEPEFVG